MFIGKADNITQRLTGCGLLKCTVSCCDVLFYPVPNPGQLQLHEEQRLHKPACSVNHRGRWRAGSLLQPLTSQSTKHKRWNGCLPLVSHCAMVVLLSCCCGLYSFQRTMPPRRENARYVYLNQHPLRWHNPCLICTEHTQKHFSTLWVIHLPFCQQQLTCDLSWRTAIPF